MVGVAQHAHAHVHVHVRVHVHVYQRRSLRLLLLLLYQTRAAARARATVRPSNLTHAIRSLPAAKAPDLSSEAYATMWYGHPGGRAFDGLKTLVQSIRLVDEQRAIVLLTLADSLSEASAAASASIAGVPNPLRMLAGAYPRVHLLPMPFYTIFRDRSVRCANSLRRSCGGGGSGNSSRYLFMYSKFALWGMTQFSRIFYIDADAVVMNTLESLWANVTLDGNIVASASYTIRVGKRPEPVCGRGWLQYNVGVMLVRPAAAIMNVVLGLLAAASYGHNNPCRSDQTLFQPWFAAKHTRCMPHSFNCRDPRVQQDATEEAAILSRCFDDARGRRALAMPHVMHFACGTMPRPNSSSFRANASIYARTWAMHLAQADARIGEQASQKGGAAQLVAAGAGVVLPTYNPWTPICYSMSPEAQRLLDCRTSEPGPEKK